MNKYVSMVTAAIIAAVILQTEPLQARPLQSKEADLPSYATSVDKTERDGNLTVEEKGRSITIRNNREIIWALPKNVLAQDFFLEDIDRDDNKELVVLCWRRGRFGRRRPTWVKEDDKEWSQHIFIYEISGERVRPKWMASDTGIAIASFDHEDGKIYITDTKGNVTKWFWASWGLEKI